MSTKPDSPHISYKEVRQAIATLDNDERRWDTITRLSWRPAWAIRSRRGTFRELRDIFRRQHKQSDDD